jgi:hypothetical protein
MRPSLDHPPAVVLQDRAKLLLRFFVFALLTALTVISTVLCSALKEQIWALLSVSFLAPIALGSFVAMLASGWSLARPASLSLDAQGLTYSAYWYVRTYPWKEIAEFVVSAPNRLRSPACTFVASHAGRRFASFGGGWEMAPEDVVALLDEAKKKWGPPPEALRASTSPQGGGN